MKNLVLSEAVLKQLQALPPNQYRHVAGAILDLLVGRSPDHSTAIEGTAYRRLAIGDYRVVYQADEEFIHLFAAGKRNDDELYRRLRQQQ